MRPHGRASRSSSRWPIPIPRSRRRRRARPARTRSSPPGAATIRTRSTTFSASPTSSAARSTCGRSTINEAMKIAAAEALAKLAREDVPDEVHTAGAGQRPALRSGIHHSQRVRSAADLRVPPAVAKAAMDCGVARRPLADLRKLCARAVGPARSDRRARSTRSWRACAPTRSRVVFAEGEEEKMVRAAVAFRNAGYGTPVLIGREERVRRPWPALGLGDVEGIEIHNARLSQRQHANMSSSCMGACSAAASCSATASAWSTRTATCSPPAWWRPAMPTRWSPG